MQVIVINGMPRAGKDEFVNFCQKYKLWCTNISAVDFVKDVATFCGWNGEKTPKNRAFLSDLKALLIEWDDVPFKKVAEAARLYEARALSYDFSSDEVLVFVHCREPEEIDKFVERMNAKTLLIRRPAIENVEQSNSSDAEVFNYDYDYVINNDGTLQELVMKAIQFLTELQRNEEGAKT